MCPIGHVDTRAQQLRLEHVSSTYDVIMGVSTLQGAKMKRLSYDAVTLKVRFRSPARSQATLGLHRQIGVE